MAVTKLVQSFDTYKHIKELQQAGFNGKQAVIIIQSLLSSRDNDISNLATKEQVKTLAFSTKQQVKTLEVSINERFKALEAAMNIKFTNIEINMATKSDIIEMQNNNIKWMIGTMVAFSGIILAAIKLL